MDAMAFRMRVTRTIEVRYWIVLLGDRRAARLPFPGTTDQVCS